MSAQTGEIMVTFMTLLAFYHSSFVIYTCMLDRDDCYDAEVQVLLLQNKIIYHRETERQADRQLDR